MVTKKEAQTLTVEELEFILDVTANPEASEEDIAKVKELRETKYLPDDVQEPFEEIAGEEDDSYYES